MAKGIVKWFSEQKGFGFIEGEDGNDVYIKKTDLTLTEGDEVTFDLITGDKGPEAENIKKA